MDQQVSADNGIANLQINVKRYKEMFRKNLKI